MTTPSIAILISGRGSNMQAMIDACQSGDVPARVAVVVSNRPGAEGLRRAEQEGIATACIDHRNFANRETFDRALLDALADYTVDLVILAGFMRILTPVFIDHYAGRLLNIHPSLLPKYPGLNTHQRAIDAGDAEAGATVHFVTAELDGGPPILHAAIPVRDNDDGDSLAQRVQTQEHRIYPVVARWFCQGRLKLAGKFAEMDGKVLPAEGLRFNSGMASD